MEDEDLMPKQYDNQAVVKKYAEDVQKREGDCLPEGFVSTLPKRTRLDLRQNDFTILMSIWDQWGESGKQANFQKKYGHIAYLFRVNVDEELIKAAIRFWDPSYRCFVFNEVDMTPTLEEYSKLLGQHSEVSGKIYRKEKKPGYRKRLAKMLGISKETVGKYEREYVQYRYIPLHVLQDFILKHTEEEQCQAVMALAIYGSVIFPKLVGHIETSVIDLFDKIENGVNPVPAILAETLRSLNYCRRKGEGRFTGCAQLLTIWMTSHFKCEVYAYGKHYLANNPIQEFCDSKWPKQQSKEAWAAYFMTLTSTDVIWSAPWMRHIALLYMCGDEPWVPLLGIWGVINYAPLMVRRQLGSSQFIPMTHRLTMMEFDYGVFKAGERVMKASKMWEKPFRVGHGIYTNKASDGYLSWHARRGKDIIFLQSVNLPSPTRLEPPVNLAEIEQAKRAQEVEKEELLSQIEKLQKELEKQKEKAEDRDMKIWQLQKEKENEMQLRERTENACETLMSDLGTAKKKQQSLQRKLEEYKRQAQEKRARQQGDDLSQALEKSEEAKKLKLKCEELQTTVDVGK